MQPHDLAIPTLPCRSVSATVAFYKRLGFEGGAHESNSDYAIMRRGAVELHFFAHEELVPANSSAGCYSVSWMWRAFTAPSHPASCRVQVFHGWISWKISCGAFESLPSSTLMAIFCASDKSSQSNRMPTH